LGSGLSGLFSFAKVSPTLDTITFAYFGSTAGAGPGSFTIDLGHFVTLDDGEVITGVTFASGDLGGATTSVPFNGTDALSVRDHIQGAASGRTVARKTCI
jgi:hypothetical protein